ncbi:MAG: hypothetical protein KG012_08475 [Deltaproteobacteria bacterium]|nr:hypothetical protein [Deltaproteobacteria bacterium]
MRKVLLGLLKNIFVKIDMVRLIERYFKRLRLKLSNRRRRMSEVRLTATVKKAG